MKPNIELDSPHNLFAYALSAAALKPFTFMTFWQKATRSCTTINKRCLLWEKTLAESKAKKKTLSWFISVRQVKTIQQSTRKAPQMGRSTAIKRRKFNKLIVLWENECGVVRSLDDDAAHCALSRLPCLGFSHSFLYSVFVAEPRAPLIRSKS